MAAPWRNSKSAQKNNPDLRQQNSNSYGNHRHGEGNQRLPLPTYPQFQTPRQTSFSQSQCLPPRGPMELSMPSERNNVMPQSHNNMTTPGLQQFRNPPPSLLSMNTNFPPKRQQSQQLPIPHFTNEPSGSILMQQRFNPAPNQQRLQEPNAFHARFGSPPPPFQKAHMPQGHAGMLEIPAQNTLQSSSHATCMGIEKNERQTSQVWVKNWLQQRNKTKKCKRDLHASTISISEAQEKTRHMIVLLAKLQKNKQQLETMKLEDRSIWEQKQREVMKIKTEFEDLHKNLTSEETVIQLKRKIAQRQSKRRRIKRQKHEEYERNQLELLEREQKRKEIDRNIEQAKQKLEQKKQEMAMKKEGDQTLSEVKKKISETTKSLQLMESLQKLRKLRTDRLARQGVLGRFEGMGGSPSQTFMTRVTEMSRLLNQQLDCYRAEEGALKVILETEHEETREKERERLKQKQEEQRLKDRKRQESMLFGTQKEACPGDPLFPFSQYYRAAEYNLDSLIQIRHDWDMYLVMPDTPGSSQIPPGWVIPTEPTSDTWVSCLSEKT